MNLGIHKKKVIVFASILCIALAGCSAKEKKVDNEQNGETKITEAVSENTGTVENAGNDGSVEADGSAGNAGTFGPFGNADAKDSEIPEMTTLAKADFNGDGTEDFVCAKEIDETGMMKDMYLVLQNESGAVSLKVPESVTVSCYQESGTEFRISCEGLSLGTTTLAEEPAYGVLGEYLEKTMGMEKFGDSYKFTINGDTFSTIDAETHGGEAFWCRGYFYVEGKKLGITWTLEYSLGEWLVSSAELPIWNLNGTTTGWESGRAELSETTKIRRFVGYLDESSYYQEDNVMQDFDGDGTQDRIWRELSGNESYTIHFGNGEKLLITDEFNGDRISCYVWKMTEETTMFWFQESGTSSGSGGNWMKLHLFEQTEDGLRRMELPEGPSLTAEVVSERKIAFYWREHEPVETLLLDEISSFADMTAEEWLERYTTEENGEYIFRLYSYDECHMMEGSLQWRTRIWGGITIAWDTTYTDGEWKTTDVHFRW